MSRQVPLPTRQLSNLTGLFLLSVLLFSARPGEARPLRDKAGSSPVRDGFTMGATVGRGSIDIRCTTCTDTKLSDALSVTGHMGYMVNPRLAIVAEHWMVRFKDRGSDLFDDSEDHLVAQHMTGLAAQLFVTKRLWVKGGFGFGWHLSDGDYGDPVPTPDVMENSTHPPAGAADSESEGTVFGTTTFVAIGVELAHNEYFAADLQLRGGTTRRSDDRYQVYNTGLNVGFNWY